MKYLAILLIFLYSCSPVLIPQFRGNCVDRAIEIRTHLKNQGYDCEIVCGTTKAYNKTINHAWIEYKLPEEKTWRKYENWSAFSEN